MRSFQTPGEEQPIAVGEGQRRVLAEVEVSGTEIVTLEEADDRVLRQEIVAAADIPEMDNSAVDGYAVLAADLRGANPERPATLKVIDDIAAGEIPKHSVQAGMAARIMTGAAIPVGADAVVPVELSDGGFSTVLIHGSAAPGANIRRAGSDIECGTVVLHPGMVLGPGEIGVLAMLRLSSVTVSARPVIGILATGNEIADLRAPSAPGRIVNSNSWALAALVRRAGGIPKTFGIVGDDLQATIEAFRAAADCDFVVSSGGVSVGAYDFVREAIEALGGRILFWRVAMKPGKPVVFSRIGRQLHFGLPGNPVSCIVSFHLFVAPAIRAALGRGDTLGPLLHAALTSELHSIGDRTAFQRVRLFSRDGKLMASPMGKQGSGVASSMINANGLAIMQQGTTLRRAGQEIEVLVIDALTE